MLIVYTLDSCPKCKLLCSYLRSLNIPFEERNALDFKVYLTSQGYSSVPVLEIDSQLFQFLSISQLIYILRERGYQV